MDYTFEDLNKRYEARTGSLRASCTVADVLVGGQPASEDGVRMFVKHHLEIADQVEADKAVARILKQEIGEKDMTPEINGVLGEVNEKAVYGVNVVRRSNLGAWIGHWQIQACLKQAASQLNVFIQVERSKSGFSEAARVSAVGMSLLESLHPGRIYVMAEDGETPAQTFFDEFRGRVRQPTGAVSIMHHSECIPSGSRFEFEFRFAVGGLKEADIRDVVAMMMVCGLGSVRSLGCGKFRVDHLSIDMGHEKTASRAERNAVRKAAAKVETTDNEVNVVARQAHAQSY